MHWGGSIGRGVAQSCESFDFTKASCKPYCSGKWDELMGKFDCLRGKERETLSYYQVQILMNVLLNALNDKHVFSAPTNISSCPSKEPISSPATANKTVSLGDTRARQISNNSASRRHR